MTEWQTIDTAPKNGARILALWANDNEDFKHTIIEWVSFDESWCQRVNGLGADHGYDDTAFSYWMPLPAAPETPK